MKTPIMIFKPGLKYWLTFYILYGLMRYLLHDHELGELLTLFFFRESMSGAVFPLSGGSVGVFGFWPLVEIETLRPISFFRT